MSRLPSVAVCIVTYRRPEGLRALLESLDHQTEIEESAHVDVIVVDNDPDRTAAPVIDWARSQTGLSLQTATERTPGVSAARNRSMQLARDHDFVAVIDDDMTAAPDWLAALCCAQRRFDADVVGGRVERSVADPSRRWVERLELFAPLASEVDGEPALAIELGNSLIRRRVLGDRPFDPRLGAIGGEDTKLFLELSMKGGRIVTTPTARAHEVIIPERTRLGWMARRAFRLGSSWSVIQRAAAPSQTPRRALVAMARAGRGLVRIVAGSLTLRRIVAVNGVMDVCTGLGGLAGLTGVTITEYGRRGVRFVRIAPRDLRD